MAEERKVEPDYTLDNCIGFHEDLLKRSRVYMELSVVYLEEETVRQLKKLKVQNEQTTN